MVTKMIAFDKNHDGKLTREEVTDERLHRLFDRADANGVVTADELKTLAEKEAAPARDVNFDDRGGPGVPSGPGGGPGGRGMAGGAPRPGQILSPGLVDRLNLSAKPRIHLVSPACVPPAPRRAWSRRMKPTTYTLLDFGNGQRLEQWGPYRMVRPDPAAQGRPAAGPREWQSADATYVGEKGKGAWSARTPLPSEWTVDFDDLKLAVRLAPYKHTGVFPEQEQNWRWTRDAAAEARTQSSPLTVLNLFAYTGGATMALAKDGHFVTHVDASKPAIAWAKANAALNELPGDRVRWILDDAPAFVARERRRGKTYDAILLDPPAFGHAPSGKAWRIERDLAPLLEDCCALLSDNPAFLVLNGYAQHDTPDNFHRLLSGIVRHRLPTKRFAIDARELNLTAKDGRSLSTGIVARCRFKTK